MRLHIKHLDPEIHGLIAQHKAACGFKNQEDTVASLIQFAMVDYPEKIKDLEEIIETLGEDEERRHSEGLKKVWS
jgi:hypothetical protein